MNNETNEQNRTVHSLQEFFAERVGDDSITPARYARLLYKSTSCGAWISYQHQLKASFEINEDFIIKATSNGIVATTKYAHGNCSQTLKDKMFSFLGFDENGQCKKQHNIASYQALLSSFSGENSKYSITYSLSNESIEVCVCAKIDAEQEDVCEDDKKARETDWLSSCVSITIGSIVEGSEVEIPPITLVFPFLELDFEEAIQEIEAQASFYWERDNSDFFIVSVSKEVYGLKVCGGDCEWDNKDATPKELIIAVELWLNNFYENYQCILNQKIKIKEGVFIEMYENDEICY